MDAQLRRGAKCCLPNLAPSCCGSFEWCVFTSNGLVSRYTHWWHFSANASSGIRSFRVLIFNQCQGRGATALMWFTVRSPPLYLLVFIRCRCIVVYRHPPAGTPFSRENEQNKSTCSSRVRHFAPVSPHERRFTHAWCWKEEKRRLDSTACFGIPCVQKRRHDSTACSGFLT